MNQNKIAKIKYYGSMVATFFVLMLAVDHISSALSVVEKSMGSSYNSESVINLTWLAGAGLQLFEVLTSMGVADLLVRRNRSNVVLYLLMIILVFFFLINLAGNYLYAISNMADLSGKDLTMADIKGLDSLQKFWVLWASVPIPLMGLAGITVMSIFRKDIKPEKQEKKTEYKKNETAKENAQIKPTIDDNESIADKFEQDRSKGLYGDPKK